MNLITLDFETYYDKEYSLSKMTMEAYIQDERFEVVGVAVQVGDGAPEWFSGTHEQTQKFLDQFDWHDSLALAHNMMFDGAILAWRFGIHPKGLLDTACMARPILGAEAVTKLAVVAEHYGVGVKGTEVENALGLRRLEFSPEGLQRYGRYCKNDVAITYALFKRLADGFPKEELRLIDLGLRMFTDPILRLNQDVLHAHLEDVAARKARLLAACAQDKTVIGSNESFAALLRRLGVEPPTKISPKTKKTAYAFAKTDEEFTDLLEHEDERVQALVAARLGVKSTIEETRTARFVDIATRGAFPVPLRYYAAHTGRYGGTDKINLQNLKRVSKLKDAMCAPPGHLVINCDSSQIEARVLAWWAGQDDLVQAFAEGQDVYKIMASSIYGVPVTEISDAQRQVGKVVILGSGYGLGAEGLQRVIKTMAKIDTPLDECGRIISIYRETYPKIQDLWKEGGKVLGAMFNDRTVGFGKDGVIVVEGKKGIRLPNGLYLHYPNLQEITLSEWPWREYKYDSKKFKTIVPVRIYGGSLVENVTQALARIIVMWQMLEVAKRQRVALTVHDSIVTVVPEHNAAQEQAFIEARMRVAPEWAQGVPLNCESKIGRNYGQMYASADLVV